MNVETTYERLMREAKAEFEQAMKDRKGLRVKLLLDNTLPKGTWRQAE